MTDQADYNRLAENLTARGLDVEQVKSKLKQQHIETPSWAYTDSGTRFHVFHWLCDYSKRASYDRFEKSRWKLNWQSARSWKQD